MGVFRAKLCGFSCFCSQILLTRREQYYVVSKVLARNLTGGENAKETRHPHIAGYWCLHFRLGCKSIKSIGQPSEENLTTMGGDTNVTGPAGTTKGSQSAWGTSPCLTRNKAKVMLVDQSLGFCVVDFMFVAKMPPAEQRYFVYRGNQQVGRL